METTRLDKSALKAVDGYWEYKRIVGDDDGGKEFTPEQYEEYRRKVLPQRMKNRLYVSFGVPGGIDCKLIGPETQCFCAHRYKQHMTDFEVVPSERPLLLPCQVKGCHCPAYNYVPRIGPNPVRCGCKHLPRDHSEATGHLCKKCSSCSGFQSPYTCGCGLPSSVHRTLVETKLEREARGRPIGRDVPYAAMGGLTGFSSLLDGYLALEASGSEVSVQCTRCTYGEGNSIKSHERAASGTVSVLNELVSRIKTEKLAASRDAQQHQGSKKRLLKHLALFAVRERPANGEMQCPYVKISMKH